MGKKPSGDFKFFIDTQNYKSDEARDEKVLRGALAVTLSLSLIEEEQVKKPGKISRIAKGIWRSITRAG